MATTKQKKVANKKQSKFNEQKLSICRSGQITIIRLPTMPGAYELKELKATYKSARIILPNGTEA